MYTNPNYFLDEWIAEQMKQRAAAKEERKKRREERRLKKEQEAAKGQKVTSKKPTKLQKVVYDPHTGQKMIITIDSDEQPQARPPQRSTIPLTDTQTYSSAQQEAPFPSATPVSYPSDDFGAPPPPPPMDNEFSIPPPPPSDSEFSPPPVPISNTDFEQPPPPSFTPPPPPMGQVAPPP
jgi:hypothetical protein